MDELENEEELLAALRAHLKLMSWPLSRPISMIACFFFFYSYLAKGVDVRYLETQTNSIGVFTGECKIVEKGTR